MPNELKEALQTDLPEMPLKIGAQFSLMSYEESN